MTNVNISEVFEYFFLLKCYCCSADLRMEIVSKKFFTAKNIIVIIFVAVLVLMSILRIYMEHYMGYYLLLVSPVDDDMQVRNAHSILNGNYMGLYNEETIPKHPMFPLFLAALNFLHIPYYIGISLLICGSALLFVIAIKPICENVFVRGIFYLFLIYNPVGFAYEFATRIYRNSLIPWAVLFVIASMVGFYLRKDKGPKKMVFWSICLGITVSFFWYLREDSIWMFPFMLVGTFAILIYWVSYFFKTYKKGERSKAFRDKLGLIIKCLILAIVPFCLLGMTRLFVSGMNKLNYNIFVTEDRVEASIGNVMSYLYRIDDGHNWQSERGTNEPDIIVSSDAIKMAQKESPTLASLDNYLDCYYRLSGGEELWADWPEWALRDAAVEKGYYRDALETEVYFAIVADELKTAFDEGRLKSKEGVFLSSQTGPFVADDFAEALNITGITINHMLHFDFCDVNMPKISDYDYNKMKNWESLLRMTFPRDEQQLMTDATVEGTDIVEDSADNEKLYEKFSDGNALALRNLLVYRALYIVYITLLAGGFIFATVYIIVRRGKGDRAVFDSWLLELGVLLTAFVNIFAVSLFSKALTPDPNVNVFCFYASSCYVLFAVALILGICSMIRIITPLFKKKASS